MLYTTIKEPKFSYGGQVLTLIAVLTINERDKFGNLTFYWCGKVEALGLDDLVLHKVAEVEEGTLDSDVTGFSVLKEAYLGNEHLWGCNISSGTVVKLGMQHDLSETYLESRFHNCASGIFSPLSKKYNISLLVMIQGIYFITIVGDLLPQFRMINL